jgi:hypothetical protein
MPIKREGLNVSQPYGPPRHVTRMALPTTMSHGKKNMKIGNVHVNKQPNIFKCTTTLLYNKPDLTDCSPLHMVYLTMFLAAHYLTLNGEGISNELGKTW